MAKNFMPNQIRSMVKIGSTVDIVLKKDQPTGKLTRGVVKTLLTDSKTHPRGIKVRLENGQVGRVQAIIAGEPLSSTSTKADS